MNTDIINYNQSLHAMSSQFLWHIPFNRYGCDNVPIDYNSNGQSALKIPKKLLPLVLPHVLASCRPK